MRDVSNILLFVPDLDIGGAQRTFVNLTNRFRRAGLDCHLVVAQGSGPAATWLEDPAGLITLNCARAAAAVRPLRRLLCERRPHALMATVLNANIVAWLASRRLPHPPALILRETNSHRSRDDLGHLVRVAGAMAYRAADRVVALSHGVQEELRADYSLQPERLETIGNPIDASALRAACAAATQRPAAMPPGRILIGVGRLHRQKNFGLAIKALAHLDSDIRLVLLGEGGERAALYRDAASLGLTERVLMPGLVADPLAWLTHADAFVLSSLWEGFGHVILEAMVAGPPVIATDCPHGPRDIIVDGRNGLLTPNDDVAAMAQAINRVLHDQDLSRRLSAAAMNTAETYDSSYIADAYLRMLTNACADMAQTESHQPCAD